MFMVCDVEKWTNEIVFGHSTTRSTLGLANDELRVEERLVAKAYVRTDLQRRSDPHENRVLAFSPGRVSA